MDEFNEIDEIKRLKDEIDDLTKDIKSLIVSQVSGNKPDVDKKIKEKKKELVELRFKLELAKSEMGDEYDRYKNNKRK